jgi:hypothetical protein
MANTKLIEKRTDDDDKREPHEKFSGFAAKILAVPKSEIDKRETSWKKARKKRS